MENGKSNPPGTAADKNLRELEEGIRTELAKELTYEDYLCLRKLLDAQIPLSKPVHDDEMLFIIQHQTSELWMKLIIHELSAAMKHIRSDEPGPVTKILARIKQIQRQLFEQWAVLETLTPSEYAQFRHVLRFASGFQSHQYRTIEFQLGNKNAAMLKVFAHDPEAHQRLEKVLRSPSIYDEFLMFLARRGHEIPSSQLERNWSQPHVRNAELVPVFKRIYDAPADFWAEYDMCEKLVDVEQSFQMWRFRHLKTVERVIGFKHGTGGSSGVNFLRRALDLTFFPELLDVRTEIGR